MSRATAILLETLDEIDPNGRNASDRKLLDEPALKGRAANDQLALAPVLNSHAGESAALTSLNPSGETQTMALTTWIDALALTLAAGVRAGASSVVLHGRDAGSSHGEPEVMDADQLAVFLGVDRKTVYEYAARSVIPHRRLGKRLLFSRSAIVSWLGSCRAASKEG